MTASDEQNKNVNGIPLPNMAGEPTQVADNIEGGKVRAPDGGWGWVVVAGAFVLNLTIGGAVNSFGILYLSLLDLHKQSAGTTAWVGSMANAMGLLLGPLSSALSARFSCRTMVIVGGVLTAAGWVSTGFMPRLEYMFLTYGLLAGIGKSLAYTPSVVMVGQWFDKRRSLANGLSVSGAGVGTFAFAPLLEFLLHKLNFSYTMIIMGGVMLTICFCGALFKPVPRDCHRKDGVSAMTMSNNNDAYCPDEIELGQAAWDSEKHKTENDIKENNESDKQNTRTIKEYLDYTLLKNLKFLCFGVSVMLATLGHSPATIMLPSLAKQNHVTSEKAAFLLSIIGITDIFGRLLFGALCDIKYLKNNRRYLYVASIFISGLANVTCGFANTYWHFATYSVIFGLFAGSYNALTPVILVDLLGIEKLSSSFGLALLFQGLGFLIGPPVAGWIRDTNANYQSAFYFAGVAMLLSSLVINLSSLCHTSSKKKQLDGQDNTTFKREDGHSEVVTLSVIENIQPSDQSANIPPSDQSASIPPSDQSANIPPSDQSANIPPSDQSAYIPPSDQSANIPPSDQSANIRPSDKSANIPPSDQSANIPPSDQSANIPPSDQSANIQPSDQSANIPPSDQSAYIRPSDQSSNIRPSDQSENIQHSDLSAIIRPDDQSANIRPSDKSANIPQSNKSAKINYFHITDSIDIRF